MSPPAPNVSSPPNKSIPVTSSSDQGYYLFSPDDDESSSEGDYDEDETVIGADGLAAKVIRRDGIAILAERWRKEQIATLSKEARSAVEGTISRRLSIRPTKEELQQRNILRNEDISEQMAREEFERKKGILTRKLSRRPTVKILRNTLRKSIKVMLEKLEQTKANNETLKVSYTTILFSGSSGVGKTSLLKKLNKENLCRYHHSTGVAQSKHTVCIKTTAVIKSAKGLHWVDLDYDSLINHLNKHLHNLRFPPAASLSMDNTLDATTSKSVMKQNRETIAKAHLAAVDIAKADSSDTPELGDVWDIINFLDTGGQPEFVNVLPAVSSSIALTFIVFNLRKRLNDFVRVEHNVNGDPSFNPYDLDCTNLEFIKRLMVSSENFNRNISSSLKLKGTQRKDGGNDSKICYVGTHAVNIKEEEIEKIDDQLSSIASELELHQRSFWSSPESKLERLFPIDMFSNGREQESYEKTIQVIRDNIQRQVQERDYYELPIIWFIFLLNLQKLCTLKKISYISYQEAVDVWRVENNSEIGLERESDEERELEEDLCNSQHANISRDMSEVHNILLFFHFMGMLFYFHKVEGISDFVFIDRQWLFEKLTELVTIKYTKGYNKKDISAEDVKKFTMEGILNISIIRNLKINLQGIEPLYFIYLLDHLNIVAPIDSKLKDYFMPCVLPSFPPAKPLEKTYDLDKCYGSIQHEPLLVGFKNGPMPHGFFCQLIVELLKKLPASWDSPLLSTSRMQHAYNNLITFPTTSGHAVSLFYKIGYIEVQIRHKSSQSSVIHYNVRHELDKILKTVSYHLQLNTEQLCYGFYCKCEEIQHFAKLKSLISPMEYIPCGYGYTKVTEDYTVWLQEPEAISSQPTLQIVKEPNMKWMHKIIIPNVSYCWKIVADYLEYPAVKKWEIEERQRGDPYKCCAELMEDWLTSDRGVAPKTWQKLVSVLKDIQGLSTSSIEQCLLKEGLLSPPETVPTLQAAAVALPSTGTNENRNEALRKDTLQEVDNISANITENASQK